MAFKVIVVGGGPVGLTAAHAFSRAGIDFVVLERRESAIIDAGSNLVLKQQGLRALSQLDMLDSLEQVSSSLEHITRIDHKGRDMGSMEFFQFTKEYFGIFPRVVSRHDLTKVLYESLSADAQSKIFTNQKVSDIQTTPEGGVTVLCADGSSHTGSLVVAADGAHSVVRDCMRRLALSSATSSSEVNDEKPFLTTYRCLWIRFPTEAFPEMRPGYTSETHGPGASTQLFVGEATGVTGIYERLDAPRRDRVRYSQAEQDALIARWGSLPLTRGGTTTLADAYANRLQSGLVSLEEGVVEHWSWDGRVVLAGDAAHKFTPSTGAGCNSGITDIVALANELHKLVSTTASPNKAQVSVALKAYQATRYESVVGGCQAASGATAVSTWATPKLKFMDRYLLPRTFLQKKMNKQSAVAVAQTPAFTFIRGQERLVGKMPWAHPITA